MTVGPCIIRVVDVEATGFLAVDGHTPCELGFKDLVSIATDLAGEPTQWEVSGGARTFINPGRLIPPEASAIHQIVDADVADAPTWPIARQLIAPYSAPYPIVAYAAHSAKTEQQWIDAEVIGATPWIDSYKVALRLVAESRVHSVQGLRFYMKPTGIDREIADRAHRAFNDAYVTAFILRDMLNASPPVTIAQMIEWSNEPALQIWCHLGDWRGHRWTDVDDGFLHWIMGKDFKDEDVVFTVKHELKRREDEWRRSQPANLLNDPAPHDEEPF